MDCERCGAGPAGADLFDHCALCGSKLCDECMAAGCCGQAPALSARDAVARTGESDDEGHERQARAPPNDYRVPK